MKVALVGFQGSGKTSVFNALTGMKAETGLGKKGAQNLGRIQVPDERVDALSKLYNPKKTTYAEIQFVDVAGPTDSGERSSEGLDAGLVNQIRESDALVHVVRGFVNPSLSRGPDLGWARAKLSSARAISSKLLGCRSGMPWCVPSKRAPCPSI